MIRNILIAVSGLTPQIITETLYCLSVQRKISVHEIYVITTARGRDVMYGIDDKINYPPLKKEIERLCKMYKLKTPKFSNSDTHIIVAKEESVEMSDIRTDKQNKLFPNKVCEVIMEKTTDKDNVLYCSVSGGRKTMSIYMAAALSLFGRTNDKLLHVLTDEKSEFKNFFPENKSEDKLLELAEVPFVKLRSLISQNFEKYKLKSLTFDKVVSLTQKELEQLSQDKLILDTKTCSVKFGLNNSKDLHPGEFDFYLKFVKAKKENKDFLNITDLAIAEGGNLSNVENIKGNILSRIQKINKKIINAVNDFDLNGLFIIQGPTYHKEKGLYGIIQDSSSFIIK